MPKKIGNVTHYYPKITVAVIKLTSGDLKLGDKVRMTAKSGEEFDQKVDSMQIEHSAIEIAKKGDEFGLKVSEEPKVPSPVEKIND